MCFIVSRVLLSYDSRHHLRLALPIDSTGQNPTGATLPLERRRAIYAIAEKYDVIILEDGKTSRTSQNNLTHSTPHRSILLFSI